MKILSIGNSFSQDAQRYLHRLVKHDGENIKAVNLFIGGCSLRTHYINMLDDVRSYLFEFNGEPTGIKISIREALVSDEWDYVTLQQASFKSMEFDSYIPYIQELADYVRKYCPKAKIMIHETWAYEDGTERLIKSCGFETAEKMYQAVHDAYAKAKDAINAHGVIPSGSAMIEGARRGLSVHRDGFHASYGVGRYLLALTWYKTLFGKDITDNSFDEFDTPVTDQERKIAIDAVNSVISG